MVSGFRREASLSLDYRLPPPPPASASARRHTPFLAQQLEGNPIQCQCPRLAVADVGISTLMDDSHGSSHRLSHELYTLPSPNFWVHS